MTNIAPEDKSRRRPPAQRAAALLLVGVLLLVWGLGGSLAYPRLALRTSGAPDVEASLGPLPYSPGTPPLPSLAPAAVSRAVEVLRKEVDRGGFPGAALAAGIGEHPLLATGIGNIGWTSAAAPVDPATTMYDLASLTKVVATTAAVMLLVEDGKMELDAPVQQYLPGFEGKGKEQVTIRHLLSHTSGLPAGTVLRGKTPKEVARRLLRTRIYSTPGSKVEYSDLGFVVLWEAARKAAGEALPDYLQRRLYTPLGMHHTRFLPGLDCEACAPTGRLRDQSLYRGKPFDATARELGGVTGSSGLFSTAQDLGRFAAMIANGGELDGVRVFHPETVRRFTRLQPDAGTRALGWDFFCPEPPESANDSCSNPFAFGHTGWTGTSLWIDPDTGGWVVLLTNRTYEARAPSRINEVRREVWDRISAGYTIPALASDVKGSKHQPDYSQQTP